MSMKEMHYLLLQSQKTHSELRFILISLRIFIIFALLKLKHLQITLLQVKLLELEKKIFKLPRVGLLLL